MLTDDVRNAQVLTHIASAKTKACALRLGVLGGWGGGAVLRSRDTAHAWQAKRRHVDLLIPNRNGLARRHREQFAGRSRHQQPGDKPPSPLAGYHDVVAGVLDDKQCGPVDRLALPRAQFPASFTEGSLDTRRSETVKPSNW